MTECKHSNIEHTRDVMQLAQCIEQTFSYCMYGSSQCYDRAHFFKWVSSTLFVSSATLEGQPSTTIPKAGRFIIIIIIIIQKNKIVIE